MEHSNWWTLIPKPPKMATTTTPSSKWHSLPTDILTTIAQNLDHYTGISLLRLRSICSSWRSSLLSPPQLSTITFPLTLPSFTLTQHSLYLLSDPTSSFLVKNQSGSNPTRFSIFNPLSRHPLSSRDPLLCTANLLRFNVSLVSKFHHNIGSDFKKVVSGSGFLTRGDFVVLGLTFGGVLLFWRFGDVGYTPIVAPGRVFDDVIYFNGKFYAAADGKGRLVAIDSRLKPVDLVSGLSYGDGNFPSLVECDGGLYLVDREEGDAFDDLFWFSVFKLDDKGCFWDFESDLNDCVFFLGDEANFALSRKVYNGSVKNVIFFRDNNLGGEGVDMVFDMKTGNCCRVVDNEEYSSLYWPPRCRLAEG